MKFLRKGTARAGTPIIKPSKQGEIFLTLINQQLSSIMSNSLHLKAKPRASSCLAYHILDIMTETTVARLLLLLFILQSITIGHSQSVASSTTTATTEERLRAAQIAINNGSPYWYRAHSNTKNVFRYGLLKKEMGDVSALVYPFLLMTYELGNRLGNYFTEVACAEAAGVHFIAVHKSFDTANSVQANSTSKLIPGKPFFNGSTLLDALPDIIVHPNPVSREEAVVRMDKYCSCTRYCWGNGNAPWINRTSTIGSILRRAIQVYLDAATNAGVVTTVSPDTDMTTATPEEIKTLPIVPDVALQYRCGDNIQFSYMYGILPFTAYPSRIPATAKYIYVLSDHPSRALHAAYTSKCQLILQGLFDFLKKERPQATIVVKRGGDLFLDYARLAFAKVTICSASTYCLWPAFASIAGGGHAHFPLSALIAGADNMQLAPAFHPNFHWINDTDIISDFRKVKPWTNIVRILEGTGH